MATMKNVIAETVIAETCYCRKWIVSWPLCVETVIVESLSFKWALQVAKNFGSEELKLP